MFTKFTRSYSIAALCLLSSMFAGAQTITATLGNATAVPADFFGFNGANFIRSTQPYYNTPWLVDTLYNLYPNEVRYPAGKSGNYWDWQKGFIKQSFPTGIYMPPDFIGIKYKDMSMLTLRTMLNRSGASPLLNMNIMSSNKEYEVAGLFYANAINLRVNSLELGSEMYLSYNNYYTAFPTAESYAQKATDWATYIKSFPGFAGYKVAAVGAEDANEPPYTRRNSWTGKVAANVGSSIDAITLHVYYGGSWGSRDVNEKNLHIMLGTPFKQFEGVKPDMNEIRAAGKEVWITEYNHFDRTKCTYDTWAHGLFLASQTMNFLEDTIITKAICHTITAEAWMACIFDDSLSLINYDHFKGDIQCNIGAPYTRPHELSASGTAISRVAHALYNSYSKRQINFGAGTPIFSTTGYKTIYGWQFTGPLYTEAIILNLDSVAHTINISDTIWNLSGGKYEQIYPGPGGPLEFIVGNPKNTPLLNELKVTPVANAAQTIALPRWSLTRVWVKKNKITAKVTDNSICAGTSTTINARGGTSYTWSGADINVLKPDGSFVEFASTNNVSQTYTVTVTDASGLTTTATVKVNAKPTLTLSASASSACKGDFISLDASLTGGNSAVKSAFVWIPSDEINTPSQAHCVAHITKTTMFSVYATDGRCWTTYDSVSVVVGPVANAGEDKMVAISSLPYMLNPVNKQPGVTYKWFKGSTYLGPDSVGVSPLVTTTYTLVAQDSSCTDTDYVIITPFTGCTSADDTTLTIPAYYTMKDFIKKMKTYCLLTGHGIATDTSLTNFDDEIVFNGPFIVNNDYSFNHCSKLCFSDGAYMIVNSDNKDLSFYNCNLLAAACSNKMWRGIVVQDYAEKLIMRNCFVQDAITGVEALNNTELHAISTRFDQCYVGILYKDFDDNITDQKVSNCKFTGKNCSKAPYKNQLRFSGISCYNASYIYIGDTTAKENYFTQSLFGIYSVNTSIEAHNNNFAGLKKSGSVPNSGTGIYLTNSHGSGNINDPLQVWPIYFVHAGDVGSAYQGNSFLNLHSGIIVENGQCDITGNSFDNCSPSISVKGCVYKNININDNYITHMSSGLDLNDNKFATVNILRNDITCNVSKKNTSHKYCLHVTDAAGLSSILNISNNTITNKGLQGIWLTNNHHAKIQDNIIYMNQTYDVKSYGILVENSDSVHLGCNLIRGNSPSLYSQRRSVSMSFSPSSEILCNTTDKTGIGFEFLADCNNAVMKTNNFQYHDDGLSIGAVGLTGGVIGPQPSFSATRPGGNFFTGQYLITTGPGAGKGYFGHAATYSIKSNAAGIAGSLNQFLVYNGDSIEVPFTNLNYGSGSTPITPDYHIKSPNPCYTPCNNPGLLRVADPEIVSADDATELKDKIAHSLKNLQDDDATNYSLKLNLLKSISNEDFKSKRSSNDLQNFYSKEQYGNAAKLSAVYKDYLIVKNAMLEEGKNASSVLQASANTVDAMNPKVIFEQNLKTIEAIKLHHLLGKTSSYSKEDMQAILSIAMQCPYTGGTAVFDARGIYALNNEEAFFDDDQLCSERNEAAIPALTGKPDVFFKAFPNPADESVNIAFNLSMYKEASFRLFDMTGREVLKSELNTSSNFKTLNLDELESGIYSYRVIADREQAASGKISIVR